MPADSYRVPADAYREYARFMAFLSAHYLECKAKYDPLSVFVSSKIDPIPYQLYDFARLMEEERRSGCIRALVAYETGLGKTILVGMIIKELLERGGTGDGSGERRSGSGNGTRSGSGEIRGVSSEWGSGGEAGGAAPPRWIHGAGVRRVLIVVPPSVLPQFASEMRDKFGLVFSPVRDPASPPPDLAIASMDTIKMPEWRDWVSGQSWDLVVVDEYHRASPFNMRGELMQQLTKRTKHFIALTATPHDGSSEKYNFRLLTIAHNPIVIRRTKREGVDISNRPLFDQQVLESVEEPQPTEEELDFYRSAEEYVRNRYRARGGGLLATLVGRAISSSIRTGVRMLRRRMEKILLGDLEGIGGEEAEELEERVREGGELTSEELERILAASASPEELMEELGELRPLVEKGEGLVSRSPIDSKGKRLYELVGELTGAGSTDEREARRKVIIFTSFRETVEYLKGLLKEFSPLEITGSTDMEERKKIVDLFSSSPLHKVLIGTDAMGESLNLQAASAEINYEVPWSPVAYIQRVGRIWRLKQEHKVLLVKNFLPPFPVEKRVMEVMLEKIKRINSEFGEIGLSVFGRELGTPEALLRQAYSEAASEAEKRIEQAYSEAQRVGKAVVEVLNQSMALPRVVNAEALQKTRVIDLSEIVTEEDLKLFLRFLKDAGAAFGEYPASLHVCLGSEYVRVDSLSLESRGMRAAIEAGKRIFQQVMSVAGVGAEMGIMADTETEAETKMGVKTEMEMETKMEKEAKTDTEVGKAEVEAGVGVEAEAGKEPGSEGAVRKALEAGAVRFNYFKEMEGWLGMAEVRISGRTAYREPVLCTPDGVLTYRGVLSLAPAFTRRETLVNFVPKEGYTARLAARWLERARALWEDGRARLMAEYEMEKDEFRREWIAGRLKEWVRTEPTESSVSVDIRPIASIMVSLGGFYGGAPGRAGVGAEEGARKQEEARGGAQEQEEGQEHVEVRVPPVEFVISSPEEEWEERREVELMAMNTAAEYYRRKGYQVRDVSAENRGYDLECTSAMGTLRVEVKGLRGGVHPELTQNERSMAAFYGPSYALFVVKEDGGSKSIYEVVDPIRNLELRVVLRPFYEAVGFEKFRVDWS